MASSVQINKAIDRAWNRTEGTAIDMVYAEVVPVVRAEVVTEIVRWCQQFYLENGSQPSPAAIARRFGQEESRS